MRDTKARFMALSAVVGVCGIAAMGTAYADVTTEPDAAQIGAVVLQQQGQIADLQRAVTARERYDADAQAQIDSLQSDVSLLGDTLNDVVNEVNDHADAVAVIDCLAYSDFHYFKERVNHSRKKYRLPIMVWRTDIKECRPAAKKKRIAS
jgi:hypothetical protein